ncbi:hypothetical protein K461DRAFT_319385 [Myriangium duriaei CBS 260.36]|uniref:Uncharacterized protein n=1 Tax=Myriangium duriaei CBS 260.36 TaxID=1168546 RepID=A0A9P4MPQ2_9PEZI|nr:hypothetical protein K461DRAFT_319385 [Myriangium duriaei CBS 260.36]
MRLSASICLLFISIFDYTTAAIFTTSSSSKASCSAADVNYVKSVVSHYVYFCNFYISRGRARSPFDSLDVARAVSACTCIKASSGALSKAKLLAVPTGQGFGPNHTCFESDITVLTDEFKIPKPFCDFYSAWSATNDVNTPISSLSVSRTYNACQCFLENATVPSASPTALALKVSNAAAKFSLVSSSAKSSTKLPSLTTTKPKSTSTSTAHLMSPQSSRSSTKTTTRSATGASTKVTTRTTTTSTIRTPTETAATSVTKASTKISTKISTKTTTTTITKLATMTITLKPSSTFPTTCATSTTTRKISTTTPTTTPATTPATTATTTTTTPKVTCATPAPSTLNFAIQNTNRNASFSAHPYIASFTIAHTDFGTTAPWPTQHFTTYATSSAALSDAVTSCASWVAAQQSTDDMPAMQVSLNITDASWRCSVRHFDPVNAHEYAYPDEGIGCVVAYDEVGFRGVS